VQTHSKNIQEIEEETGVPVLDVNIQNVVATGVLDQEFNLRDIQKAFIITEYNPRRFPGLVFRLRRPKTTTLIFRTGKMVCTGAKSAKMAKSAIRKVVRELKKKNIIILNKPKIYIQNIVASGDLTENVDLELAADLLDNVMYEPEQFPGIMYRMRDPKVVILVFTSGKIVITGAKNKKMVQEAIHKLYKELDDYSLFF
jgi:transcription initiation factor TFIID TATA-box-binding protein